MSKQQKLFFPENIRFLRTRKGLSQQNLAQQLDLTRVKLNALESGTTKNPAIEDLVKFSEFFKISIDSLLKVKLSKLLELQLRELESGNDVYMLGSKIRVLSITVNPDNKENMEYVPVPAKAGYQTGYADPQFLAGLPKFTLPNLPKQGTFRMFPITGDSMLPIAAGSDVITQYVEDWKSIKAETLCIVVLKGNQDFVFKQVTLQNDRQLLLQSLNPAYSPYTVDTGDVLEIWRYVKHVTDNVPQPQTDLQQIKHLLASMQQQLQEAKTSTS